MLKETKDSYEGMLESAISCRALYEEEKQCLKEFSSYEDACEAAIKYCLENLI